MGQPDYDLRNIHKLITEAYSLEDLRSLSMYEFRAVYEDYGEAKKSELVRHLMEYCERKGIIHTLLAAVKADAPGKYAQYEGKLVKEGDTLPSVSSGSPPQAETVDSIDSEIAHIKRQIELQTRRLRDNELLKARLGIETPTMVKMEIEDLEKEIDQLKQRLVELESFR